MSQHTPESPEVALPECGINGARPTRDAACYVILAQTRDVVDVVILALEPAGFPQRDTFEQELRAVRNRVDSADWEIGTTVGLPDRALRPQGARVGYMRRWRGHRSAVAVCPWNVWPGFTCLTEETVKILRDLPRSGVATYGEWQLSVLALDPEEGRKAVRKYLDELDIGYARTCQFKESTRLMPEHPRYPNASRSVYEVQMLCTFTRR
ncbi:MAG: hypothetical protein KC653_02250 [Candidatus Andersenbacteria bacterium]|nr:hypothetical protein [Candidatus Andersenbacteria bacterium]